MRKRAPIEAIPDPLESSRGAYADETIAACPPTPVGVSRSRSRALEDVALGKTRKMGNGDERLKTEPGV